MNEYQKPALKTPHDKKVLFCGLLSMASAFLVGFFCQLAPIWVICGFFITFFGTITFAYATELYERALIQVDAAYFIKVIGDRLNALRKTPANQKNEVDDDAQLIDNLRRAAWSDGKILLAILSSWLLIFSGITIKNIAQGQISSIISSFIAILFVVGWATLAIHRFRIKA